MRSLEPTSRTTLRRLPARGEFDREAIYAILDEAYLCHVGFLDEGRPAVVPTAFGREADWLYMHGSNKNRALRAIVGAEACLTVTLLDAFVLARSTFHHSFNYRSVIAYGKGEEVSDPEEKLRAVNCITEHIVPGRTAEARTPNEKELRATLVVRFPLEECSAKVRSGDPKDDEEDMALPVWAGLLPVVENYGPPAPAADLGAGIEPSAVVLGYRRPAGS